MQFPCCLSLSSSFSSILSHSAALRLPYIASLPHFVLLFHFSLSCLCRRDVQARISLVRRTLAWKNLWSSCGEQGPFPLKQRLWFWSAVFLFTLNSKKRRVFFRHFCVSKVITTTQAHKIGVILHTFQQLSKKKIKKLRPKTTKIDSRGPDNRSTGFVVLSLCKSCKGHCHYSFYFVSFPFLTNNLMKPKTCWQNVPVIFKSVMRTGEQGITRVEKKRRQDNCRSHRVRINKALFYTSTPTGKRTA